MIRLLVYIFGLTISMIVMLNSDPNNVRFVVSSGLAIGFVIPLIDTLVFHLRTLKVAWYSLRTWQERVRISASYLFRIQVDGDYLLLKGARFDQYQPVGGVYKAHPSSSGRLRDMKILNDDLLVPDDVSKNDLRIRVPGRELVSFVRWFEEGRGRETDGCREFYEELVAPGILSQDNFRLIEYDRIERLYHPLRYSKWAGSQELLIADILELIPTSSQLSELRQLKGHSDPRILWASEKQIRRLGVVDGSASQATRIAETAVWALDATI